ncbi:hypothetical protein B0H12DRAFT_496926 [Mycena haematopus]|nr:hypothetical protein B0H12DRAFT_496926 [Mycena haematopus]
MIAAYKERAQSKFLLSIAGTIRVGARKVYFLRTVILVSNSLNYDTECKTSKTRREVIFYLRPTVDGPNPVTNHSAQELIQFNFIIWSAIPNIRYLLYISKATLSYYYLLWTKKPRIRMLYMLYAISIHGHNVGKKGWCSNIERVTTRREGGIRGWVGSSCVVVVYM